MSDKIIFERRIPKKELVELLSNITVRGIYQKDGNKIFPYKNAKFSLAVVHPPRSATSPPQLMHNFIPQPLFTSQPTIYNTQISMLKDVDKFLKTIDKRIHKLGFEGIQYTWKDRGMYQVLPPIIEKHSYPLLNGALDLKKILKKLKGVYVKDAKGNLHELSKRYLRNFYIDQHSKISHLDLFNSNVGLINYGLKFNGNSDFYIICDGSHRMDLALETLNEPINVILVESDDLLPYYALPMPFRPTTRLSSKEAEKMYHKLERDKVHLFNKFLKKVLHYNWKDGGLYVSKLRSKSKIY